MDGKRRFGSQSFIIFVLSLLGLTLIISNLSGSMSYTFKGLLHTGHNVTIINTHNSSNSIIPSLSTASVDKNSIQGETEVHDNVQVGCKLPKLDPWDPQIRQYIEKHDPLNCQQSVPAPFTYIQNNTHLSINDTTAKLNYPKVNISACHVQFFERIDDRSEKYSEPVAFLRDIAIPNRVEYIYVYCGDPKDYWYIHYRFLEVSNISYIRDSNQKRGDKRMSVLLFMADQISQAAAKRYLPKTFNYLIKELGGIALNGFHSVGHNTFPNMVPLLTGHYPEELGDPAKELFDNLNWPFLWQNFSGNGYITGYAEDMWYSTFNYLKKGFKKQPTDYYPKNYLNTLERKAGSQCKRERAMHQVMLDLLKEFLQNYREDNYFYLHFINALSHDNTAHAQIADQDYHQFFSELFSSGVFNNTLVILASDHGPRFGAQLKTSVGQAEARLPLNVLVFPPWFKNERAKIFTTILRNAESLVTYFDIHETLLDVAEGTYVVRNHQSTNGSILPRGLSLYGAIPKSRTCEEAMIPPQYCVCRNLTDLSPKDPAVLSAANASVQHIRYLLRNHGSFCAEIKLHSISSARITTGMTKTLSDGTDTFSDIVLVFQTMPGGGRFEADIRQHMKDNSTQVMGTIDRINKYGSTSSCIMDNLLRNYCYCKNLL